MRILEYSWLLFISLFQILYFSRVSGLCLDDQRYTLLKLRNSLIFNASLSRKLVMWNLKIEECCSWEGVGCDSSGHVTSLELDGESIHGGLENSSSSLFNLRYLKKFNLACNNFNGAKIPIGLHLNNLSHLNLSNAGFGGQIPIQLSEMRSLVSLDLSSIFLFFMPLKLENSSLKMLFQNLTCLEEVYLDGVQIAGQEDGWWQDLLSVLPNIRILSLRNCRLSGPVKPSVSRFQSLSVLHLDGNNLSTTNLEIFSKFTNLTILSLSFCSLNGHFPEVIFQVPSLQYLDLSNNVLLCGTIPQFPLRSSFRAIILSNTNFSSSLPDSISNLPMLFTIDLSNCNFSGQIPSSIANLVELDYLDFSCNSFTGTVPLFNVSSKLTYMDLSHNDLTDILKTTHFKGLHNLSYIDLSSNSLKGSIPTSLFTLPSLQKLILSHNKFSDQINEFPTMNTSRMEILDLSSNFLEGSIPESFFNLVRLNIFSISYNFFNGTVKLQKFQNFPNLTSLNLAYNSLSVDVRSSNSELSIFPLLTRLNLASCNLYEFPNLKNQKDLTNLDLSNNKITGNIPSSLWQVGKLRQLNISHNTLEGLEMPYFVPPSLSLFDLHSNNLHGTLPLFTSSSIYVDFSGNNFEGSIPEVDIHFATLFLSLANNGLSGAIPTSLCKLFELQVLDLSGNSLSGVIPPCLVAELNTLGVLNLARNNISGVVPDTFSISCGLQTLDFSSNNLQGTFPASVANCKSLEVLNVGNNLINDRFPCMLKNSSNLRVLVLRSNNFYGDIKCPRSNFTWSNLQIFDIAINNFTGYLYDNVILGFEGMKVNTSMQAPNHLRFYFLDLSNLYYQDTVVVTTKHLELEIQTKILTIFTSIDFSCNNFEGEIPNAIGESNALYVLNLSHNSFSDTIPKSIGKLMQLESLDLSANLLTGKIPQELSSLPFLSVLNLSLNNLVGRIPAGSQFQTFSNESFEGNSGLCGFPLTTDCITANETRGRIPIFSISTKNPIDWMIIFIVFGFVWGVSLAIAALSFSLQYNKQLDRFLFWIYPKYNSGFGQRKHRKNVIRR